MTVRWAAIAAAMLAIGCTCASDKRMAEIEEPIEAEIVWRTVRGVKWAGGGHYVVVPTGIGKDESAVLKADGFDDRPLPEYSWSKQTSVELGADATGARLGYRESGKEWRVVYLAAKEHVFVGDTRYAALGWEKVPSFEAAAVELFTAQSLNRQDCVLDEIEKRGGQRALADLLIETANVHSDTAWKKGFTRLPPAEQARVTADLRGRLLAKTKGPAIGRALRHVRLRDPALASALVALAKEHADAAGRSPRYETKDLAILLRASAALRPAETAPIACRVLDQAAAADASAAAFVALAIAKEPCAAAEKQLHEKLCEPELLCAVDPECPNTALAEARKLELETDASTLADRFITTTELQLRMALWATALDPPPAELDKTRKRMSYPIQAPKTPRCALARRDSEACACDEKALRRALCRAADASVGETQSCRFRIDDAARRIFDVRSKRAGAWLGVASSDTHVLGAAPLLCGVAADRSVQCRGWPAREDEHTEPVTIAEISDAREVALSDTEYCALSGDGGVRCWHAESDDGAWRMTAAEPVPLDATAAIAAFDQRVCALGKDARVHCWTKVTRSKPEPIAKLAGSKQLTASSDYLSALSPEGRGSVLACTGKACTVHSAPWSAALQLYAGARVTFAIVPGKTVETIPTTAIVSPALDAGASHPTALRGISDAVRVVGSSEGGCALTQSGAVTCWDEKATLRPAVIRDATSITFEPRAGIGAHVAATRSDGSLAIWRITGSGVEAAVDVAERPR